MEDRVCLTTIVAIDDGSCRLPDDKSQMAATCEVGALFDGDLLTWRETAGTPDASDEPHFPTEEETQELIKKLIAIVNSDSAAGIEGSDIGSGGLTGAAAADGTSDEPHFPTEEETQELIKKLVAIVNSDSAAGIEGSDIGTGGLTGSSAGDRIATTRRTS